MPETDHAVLIAGGGPTGLMLAGELALAGIDAAVVERRANQDLVGWRALGFHARTIEVLDQRGIADRFIKEALVTQTTGFGGAIRLDISDFPTRHNYGLGLRQARIEQILAGWVDELGVPILRGREVTGFTQDDEGVSVELSDGVPLRAEYLVGCDGGRSVVRKAAGIDFAGWDATGTGLIAEAEFDQEPEWGMRRDAHGVAGFSRPDPDGPIRAQAAEEEIGHGEPTLEDLRKAITRYYGTDFGLRGAAWITRFSDATRQATAYRAGRVLLAGDAAHIHSPMGGQGLGVGVQDAVNLGWKLAQVVKGISPETLLDTYHAERHPVAARVLHNTMAQVALSRVNDRTDALRDIVSELARMEEPRKYLGGMMSGLDIHYDLSDDGARDGEMVEGDEDGGYGGDAAGGGSGDAARRGSADRDAAGPGSGDATGRGVDAEAGAGAASADVAHPLLGRRMPDLDIVTPDGPLRVFTLLYLARPVLLNLGTPGARTNALRPWSDRVQLVDATYDGPWELPVVGSVTAPAAVLVRPDGHVAWVGESDIADAGLTDALIRWFGPAELQSS
jgi:3-(3-hydroxy-phenyl)propionate hydroxylase